MKKGAQSRRSGWKIRIRIEFMGTKHLQLISTLFFMIIIGEKWGKTFWRVEEKWKRKVVLVHELWRNKKLEEEFQQKKLSW